MLDTVLAGLQIFHKYTSNDIAAEHDVIYAGACPPESMPSDDLKILKDSFWYWDEELECWYYFC
jgi:hypothetical protein